MGAFEEINSTLNNSHITRRAPAALVESVRNRFNEIARKTPWAGMTASIEQSGSYYIYRRSDGYVRAEKTWEAPHNGLGYQMNTEPALMARDTAERARLSEELKQSPAYQRLLNPPQTWTGERAPFQSFRSSDGVGIGKDRFTHGSFDFFQNILRRVDEL